MNRKAPNQQWKEAAGLYTQAWTKNNPMNVQLVPEPFVEMPVELAAELGIKGGELVKVSSARGSRTVKAMVTRRIRPGSS